jgi:hypothetical protein
LKKSLHPNKPFLVLIGACLIWLIGIWLVVVGCYGLSAISNTWYWGLWILGSLIWLRLTLIEVGRESAAVIDFDLDPSLFPAVAASENRSKEWRQQRPTRAPRRLRRGVPVASRRQLMKQR